MIDMIGTLISDGEDQRQAAIDKEAAAQTDVDEKTGTHTKAIEDVTAAEGALNAAKAELVQFISEKEEAKNIHDQATVKKADAKTKTNEEQGARIDEEKETFEEIKSLIATISE